MDRTPLQLQVVRDVRGCFQPAGGLFSGTNAGVVLRYLN